MARSLSGVAFKSGPNKGKHKSEVCAGLNKGGANKGRLKKGFKWTKTGACPVPVAGAPASAKKKSKSKAVGSKGCAGLNAKGKVKKGFRWKKGGKCPVKTKAK